MKFIKDIMDEKIVIYKNSKKNIVEELIKLKYKKICYIFALVRVCKSINKNIMKKYEIEIFKSKKSNKKIKK